MNYNKLVFHEDTWPDVVGRTLTFNCKRYELELKTIEGIRSCSITMAECIAFRSRFELSHIDTWAAEYHYQRQHRSHHPYLHSSRKQLGHVGQASRNAKD